MVKQILLTATILFLWGVLSSVFAQSSLKQSSTEASKTNYKFLEDISVDPATDEKPAELMKVAVPAVKKDLLNAAKATGDGNVESAGALQFKYSLLLNVEV